ncbi:MAG TPA: thioesterase family protein [Methyloceanibacter sp.]|nr:thioesterase family protein [Methyloceanibacter sp.]
MLTNTRTIRVQWGDCDPAGIVYYPRYFEWFDASTILLFEKATGMTKVKMLEKYEGAGLALLEARAIFKVASHYGEDIDIETQVTEFRRSSFFLRHKVTKAGVLALEGYETRLWTVRDPKNNNRLRSGAIPPEVLAGFQRP